ncbi:hypothetical protein GCM10025792_48530 [Pseudonocardia tropica]
MGGVVEGVAQQRPEPTPATAGQGVTQPDGGGVAQQHEVPDGPPGRARYGDGTDGAQDRIDDGRARGHRGHADTITAAATVSVCNR